MDSNPFNYNDENQFLDARQSLFDRLDELNREVNQYLDDAREESDALDRLRHGLSLAVSGVRELDDSAPLHMTKFINDTTVMTTVDRAIESYNGFSGANMYYFEGRFVGADGEASILGFFVASLGNYTDWHGHDRVVSDLHNLPEFKALSYDRIEDKKWHPVSFCSESKQVL